MSAIKLCSICYVPPPSFPGSAAFLQNIRAWKTAHDLILYSDHDYGEGFVRINASPEVIKGVLYPDGRENTWAVNNLVWLTGLRILQKHGYTHFIYLESDCRVSGHGWDAKIFDDFFSVIPTPLVGGTIVGYNINNRDITFSRLWNGFIADNELALFPITSFGGVGAAMSHEPAILANGALGVYDFDYVHRLFPMDGAADKLAALTAWDYHVGRELVREFGERVFQNIAHLDRVYSSYGNVQTTEEARLALLTDGAVVAVHQVKSDATGPMPTISEPAEGAGHAPALANAQPPVVSLGASSELPQVKPGTAGSEYPNLDEQPAKQPSKRAKRKVVAP